jgi:hypothetical protein
LFLWLLEHLDPNNIRRLQFKVPRSGFSAASGRRSVLRHDDLPLYGHLPPFMQYFSTLIAACQNGVRFVTLA